MKKKAIILSCLLAAAIPMTAVTASAEPAQTEGETVNLFETESDWKHNKSGNAPLRGGQHVLRPRDGAGQD